MGFTRFGLSALVDWGVLKIKLMKHAKHAIARPRRGRAMACFADTNWALRTPLIVSPASSRYAFAL
jgi:hypothetical protein